MSAKASECIVVAPPSHLTDLLKYAVSLHAASAVRRPVDLLYITLIEALPVKGASARSNLAQLREAHLAEHVAAGEEYLDVVAVVSAATACHFWLPQLVFHARDLQVHARDAQLTWRHCTTLQLLLRHLSNFLLFRHLLLHLCVRVVGHLQARQRLRLTQLRLGQLTLQSSYDFVTLPGQCLVFHHDLSLHVQLILQCRQQLAHSFLLRVRLILVRLKLSQFLLLHLAAELEVHVALLHLLLLRLQLHVHLLMFVAVRLQLGQTLHNAVNLRIRIFQLLVLGGNIVQCLRS